MQLILIMDPQLCFSIMEDIVLFEDGMEMRCSWKLVSGTSA